MGLKKTIDSYSIKYDFIRYGWINRCYKAYYGKKQICGRERIPRNQPVILAINHQNALMDAMAFVTHLKQQSVFMARADIFKKPIIIKILTFLKIMPIFRMRDGVSNLQKNDEIFDATYHILKNKKNPLAIFPEGNHGEYRRLRPLTKGIFRIAFRAQADYGTKPGIKIVPIGIDYGNYQKFRSTLFMNIGQPIEVSEFWKDYEENQAVGINKLRVHLASEMKKLMIHIETEEFYDLYMGLRELYNPLMRKELNISGKTLLDKFISDKEIIERLDKLLEQKSEEVKTLNDEYFNYLTLRTELNFRDWLFRKKISFPIIRIITMLLSLVTLPIVILGNINNWPHYYIPPLLGKKIKDPQFVSTAKWGMGVGIIMVYYPLLTILAIIFIPWWWGKIFYIILLPLSGLYAFYYRNFLVKSWARIRFWHKKFNGNQALKNCEDYHKTIIDKFKMLSTK